MRPHKILIVDDMPENLEAIVNIVEHGGEDFEILQALEGKTALFIANAELPDLIITDWEMPGMDGIQLIRALKSNDSTREIPVIMCTGIMTTSENLKTALEAGAVDYIRKPVDHVELSARVRSMIALRNTQEDLKATQDKLVQSEKLASMGEVTAGIAHEIQNPLNFVNNFARVSESIMRELLSEMREEIKIQKDRGKLGVLEETLADLMVNLEKIKYHGERASHIVDTMMQLSGPNKTEPASANLNRIVQEFINLSYHGSRGKYDNFQCTIEINTDDEIKEVVVLQQEIGRVLLNLFNNAFDAMQEKQLRGNPDYKPQLRVSTHRLPNGVEIRVRDNGIGIPEDKLKNIFTPFFTTKATGKGLGLGLSLCYDMVVKGHGGDLRVETEEGKFTEMIIFLPQ